jgi:hypothetical protein
MDWNPIDSIPVDEEVRLRWADGATAIGMKMSPPPISISKDQRFWWGVDALSFGDGDWAKERENHQPEDAIEWARSNRADDEDYLPV